jgi:sialate O-acetylesterase
MKKNIFLLLSIIILSTAVKSEVRLPRFVSDGMILQRDQTVPIWGWGASGEKITILFDGKTYSTQAGADLKWKVNLKSQPAGGPFIMVIKGNNTITLRDILFGDVWLCSGQSNMEAVMARPNIKAVYGAEIEKSENSFIRQFTVKRKMAFKPADDVESDKGWVSANPETVLNFSAVAYFFAKDLYEKYKIPIGLINSSVGGTPAQSWINSESLSTFLSYYNQANLLKNDAEVEKILLNHKNKIEKWKKSVKTGDKGMQEEWFSTPYETNTAWTLIHNLSNWSKQFSKPKYGVVWFKTEMNIPANLVGKDADLFLGFMQTEDETYVNGKKIGSINSGYTLRNYKVEAGILKEGKNVITIRMTSPSNGVSFDNNKSYKLQFDKDSIELKDQWMYRIGIEKEAVPNGNGLSAHSASAYYYPMIKPLAGYGIKGVIWYQGESNVAKPQEYQSLFSSLITLWRKDWENPKLPFLYVQLPNFSRTNEEPATSNLALIREAQTQILTMPFTGMAVTHDIGEKNEIHPPNKQDVGKRLALAAQKIAYHEHIVYSGPTYKSINIIENKAYLAFDNIGSGLKSIGEKLNYFRISSDGKNFVEAQAMIKGNKVVVWSDKITQPIAVHYAWADSPDGANLYNKEGLPASSFRTDK